MIKLSPKEQIYKSMIKENSKRITYLFHRAKLRSKGDFTYIAILKLNNMPDLIFVYHIIPLFK